MTGLARELWLLAEVVEHGSFSGAARAVGVTPSAVSKAMARLEERLGVRVLERTTRRQRLTVEGEVVHRRAVRMVEAVRDAERSAASLRDVPTGRLVISASAPVAQRLLVPHLAAFRERHPQVEVDLQVTDTVVDLLRARADVALRVGPLPDSSLRARRLFTNHRVVVGAPGYLERRGRPRAPEELVSHDCLLFDLGVDRLNRWAFRDHEPVAVSGPVRTTSGEALCALAVAGLGLARLGRFLVADDLAAGRLEAVLEPWEPEEGEPVHAVYLGEGPVPARVRVFVDHMVALDL